MRAIPTKHNGRQYRSRLEARWASFFDRIGWAYEYEPFDLKGWIPDFLLMGVTPVLVEVKPVAVFPQTIADEIERACVPNDYDILILGCTLPISPLSKYTPQTHALGWLAERFADTNGTAWFCWGDAVLGSWAGTVGFCHHEQSFRDRISGEHTGSWENESLSVHDILSVWADAGNATQWMAPKK